MVICYLLASKVTPGIYLFIAGQFYRVRFCQRSIGGVSISLAYPNRNDTCVVLTMPRNQLMEVYIPLM